MINKRYKKLAFTLAEVLIVLGIIGVVAEMTIPSLVSDFQEQANIVAFKKAYSVASQAWSQVVNENPGLFTDKGGWVCTWADGTTDNGDAQDGRHEYFKAKMKVIKFCQGGTGCWPYDYETKGVQDIIDTGGTGSGPSLYSWVNADGMCWSAPAADFGIHTDNSHILVDTNCGKKPNRIGEDIFSFLLGVDGVVYFAIDDDSDTGIPVKRGKVCPMYTDPATINGRSISFKSMLFK